MAIKTLYCTIVVSLKTHKNKMSDIASTILLIHVYIYVSCALLDADVASVQRRMPHGNGQVNWVSYSLLCKHIQVLFSIQSFEQRRNIFVIDRSFKHCKML